MTTIDHLRAGSHLPRAAVCLLAALAVLSLSSPVRAASPRTEKTVQQPPAQDTPKSDAAIAGDEDLPPGKLPANSTPAQRIDAAWSLLTEAAGDDKHAQTRIEALAALGMLRNRRAEHLIEAAMKDSDVDVRTAAALATGQSGDRNLTTPLRNLLDDDEPQVAFIAAMMLWKMGDPSGEDILMAVANGDRSTNPSLVHGTEHKIDRELHQPGKLARLGAMQGAAMMLGPFGFGIAAFQFIHQSGGDLARAAAIEQIGSEHTPPVHTTLLDALGDKDAVVRAAAARGLVEYRDKATSLALYNLFVDPKHAVRLTAAAAYLRTTGIPGPGIESMARTATARVTAKH